MTTLDLTNIDELVAALKEADDIYFNSGEELYSDAEYDNLKMIASKLAPKHPYFTVVGSDVRGGKVKLPYIMGGLSQLFQGGDVESWILNNNLKKKQLIISQKLDGISVLMIFDCDGLKIAYSRGNGLEAADITRHVKHLKIPQKIEGFSKLVVRAEIIMKNSVFEEHYAKDYANARNFVAGKMNASKTDMSILNHIDVVAYQIVDCIVTTNTDDVSVKIKMFNKLKQLGFNIPFYYVQYGEELNDEKLVTIIKTEKKSSDYELDGIVISVDNVDDVNKVTTSLTLNPDHSVKYKIIDEENVVDATVKNIHWEISMHGKLKPIVEIYPVKLFGTMVTFATGYNAKFIYNRKLEAGSIIKITKGGSTIPKIL